jgi:hypothetical protein
MESERVIRPRRYRNVPPPFALGGAAQPLRPPFGVAPPPLQFGGPPHLQAFIKTAQPQATRRITRALILSLSVCYHARLQDRTGYEKGVSRQFMNPLSLPGGVKQFRDEIRWSVLSLVASKCLISLLIFILGAKRFSWII